MALADLFTTAQLEIACGGADRLMRLAHARVVGDATYAAFCAEVKALAFGKVRGVIGQAFALRDPTTQTAELLQQYALGVAVYCAHIKGSGGQEVPQGVRDHLEFCMDGLRDIRSGTESLGTETDPATTLRPQQVDMEAGGAGWTRSTWGGFC